MYTLPEVVIRAKRIHKNKYWILAVLAAAIFLIRRIFK